LGKAKTGGAFGLKLSLGLQYHRGVLVAFFYPFLGGYRGENQAQ